MPLLYFDLLKLLLFSRRLAFFLLVFKLPFFLLVFKVPLLGLVTDPFPEDRRRFATRMDCLIEAAVCSLMVFSSSMQMQKNADKLSMMETKATTPALETTMIIERENWVLVEWMVELVKFSAIVGELEERYVENESDKMMVK